MSDEQNQRQPPRFLPRAWAASLEAESREWMIRCPNCGHEQSVWESGGIRWKASGSSRQYRRCPQCGTLSWQTVYRPRDGAAPPLGVGPRQPAWKFVVACVLVGIVALALFLSGLFFIISRTTVGPRAAANGYFAAVIAEDWIGAQEYLSASQRDTITPTSLAATWATRTSAHGAVTSYRITGFRVQTTTGRISGTLRYSDGTTEGRTVQLVKEGDDWRIASAP